MILSSQPETHTEFFGINTYQHDSQEITKMTSPSMRYIEDLSAKDTRKLTQLLTISWRASPSLQWLSEQERAISHLPSSLLRSEGLLPRLAMSLPFAPQRAHLCSTHKPLNPYLIHHLFFQLSAECTIRLNRLVENAHLPENLVKFVNRMHGINALWLSPFLYRSIFGVSSDEEGPGRVESGCEACILAVVGADHRMLCDLRASMLGRRKKGLPLPRLLKIVDTWIDGTGSGAEVKKESDVLEKEIRGCRRQMQKARRQIRRNTEQGIVDYEVPEDEEPLLTEAHEEEAAPEEVFEMDWMGKDENAEHYFEESILDYYTRESKMNLESNSPAPTPEDMHPAFRESMVTWSFSTGTFRHRDTPPSPPPRCSLRPVPLQQLPPPRAPTAYTASVYSRSAFDSSPSYAESSVPELSTVEEQARAYRNLTGMGTKNERSARRRTQASKLSAERVTRWMDFS
jgi:hypothetical protein